MCEGYHFSSYLLIRSHGMPFRPLLVGMADLSKERFTERVPDELEPIPMVYLTSVVTTMTLSFS